MKMHLHSCVSLRWRLRVSARVLGGGINSVTSDNPMWTCPKCKQKFVNKNQSHSCGNWTVEEFLSGKTDHSVKLFNSFLDEFRTIGDFELHPVKTRVALLTMIRFASINKIGSDFVDGHLVLVEPMEDDCFRRVENLGDRFYVHHFRITDISQIRELRPFMKKAYAVGQRDHVRRA
jgi:hypothetical protein